MKGIFWTLAIILAILIGLYPSAYFFMRDSDGLLSTKTAELLSDKVWRFAFYAHIFPGGLALLTGWPQFIPSWRTLKPHWHRILGKIYIISVLVSGLAGLYIGFYATGGLVSQTGFIALALIWLFTTLGAFLKIKKREVAAHERWMIFSYAATFAAVTLRLWLPMLIGFYEGDFDAAYPIVAWLCWVPNMGVAWWLVRRTT